MSRLTLVDGQKPFDVTILESNVHSKTVLFAVGSGGDPGRHQGLLNILAGSGLTIVAPHFERLLSSTPSESDLLLRTRRLSLALDAVAQPESVVVGIGHSIGATALLALAGGHMWLDANRRIEVVPDQRLSRLVLLAPPTGFFQPPGALEEVTAPILAWAGSEDSITPPDQVHLLKRAMSSHVPVDVRVTDGAGHFSFMDVPPPRSLETMCDRQAFLDMLALEVRRYVVD